MIYWDKSETFVAYMNRYRNYIVNSIIVVSAIPTPWFCGSSPLWSASTRGIFSPASIEYISRYYSSVQFYSHTTHNQVITLSYSLRCWDVTVLLLRPSLNHSGVGGQRQGNDAPSESEHTHWTRSRRSALHHNVRCVVGRPQPNATQRRCRLVLGAATAIAGQAVVVKPQRGGVQTWTTNNK